MLVQPADAVVDLWLRNPSVVLAGDRAPWAATPEAVLDAVERDRLQRFADWETARSYAAAHLLARTQIGRFLGRAPEALRFDRTCDDCGAQHGRPRLVDVPTLYISLSRTPALVAVALSRSGPVGVDVEPHAAASFAGYAEVALHPDERPLAAGRRRGRPHSDVTDWVRKEAALKALGVGLRVDPASFRTPRTGQPEELMAAMPSVTVVDVPADGAHAVAVAVASATGGVRVRQH